MADDASPPFSTPEPPIEPGVPVEPTVAEPEPLEDEMTVIIQVISFVATIVLLLVTYSLRVHLYGKKPRKYKKVDTLPGPKDAEHVEQLLKGLGHEAAEELVPALLAGIAASPVLLDAAKVQKLGDRTSRQLRGGLAGCVAGWKQLEAMGLGPEARQGLLLILHQLYQHKLGGVRLTVEEVQQRDDVASLVGQLLLDAFEAACKRQLLQPGVALARLIACFRLGLWSWEDPECQQLTREGLGATPYPRITLSASVKSWMGAPALAPGCTMELAVTVHREHAGPTGAPHQRLVWRGQGEERRTVPIMESYTCLLSREVDGTGGAKGSMVARLEVEVRTSRGEEREGQGGRAVDYTAPPFPLHPSTPPSLPASVQVEDLEQAECTTKMKMFAPKQPGDYEMRVRCFAPPSSPSL